MQLQHIFKQLPLVLGLAVVAACTPESGRKDLGPLPVASFTATPLGSNPNKIVVKSTTPGAFLWSWNYANNLTSRLETDTFSFPKKGEYSIQLTAFTHGGYATAAQKVNIANDMPAVNILPGSDLTQSASSQYWTVLNTGGTQTSINFTAAGLVFSNTGNSNGAIFQGVKVNPAKDYILSMQVQGSGATNSWFEVYVGTDAPVQGKDYSGNKFISLNTWAGCGNAPFNGDLAAIGCSGSGTGAGGKLHFTSNNTVYILIKAGSSGGTLGNGGITVANVKLLEQQ
ncbi:PKD domain-containing protein [Chitinophaga vietnamensis]|uniref:PKD domain-containing protein n=1 Tax=Chitinophaga vietnamensis TaxID=2593957 RepID=UPI001178A8A1|nr:PKD domain-containing protein [Chitinophaga vietnamensis]